MKAYIRTAENGKRLSLERVNEKRISIKKDILARGFQYTENETVLGSLNAMGERIEETVYIIEDVTGVNYV